MEVDRKGRLYVVWELFPDHRKAPRGLELAVSLDGGRTFSPPVVLTGSVDPGGENGSHQGLLMKKLGVNNRGGVAVVNSSLVQDERSRVWVMPGRLEEGAAHHLSD